MTDKERLQKLDKYISDQTLKGYTVADRNESEITCVMVKSAEKVNHVLHFILSVLTAGFYLIVWLIIASSAKGEDRIKVSVNSTGEVTPERVKKPTGWG